MADGASFEHTALEDPARQIRLLKLEPSQDGDNGDTIRLSLTVHGFGPSLQTPPYTALSYTWGPPRPTRQVTLNDKAFSIRENLWLFLRAIHPDSAEGEPLAADTYLWIDQLTIDQSNSAEKSHQVAMMGDIYSRAATVLVWLGPAGADSLHAEAFINARSPQRSALAITTTTPEMRRGAARLLHRPYWTRLWVIQELALARKLAFRCGAWTFPFNDLTRLTGLEGASDWVVSCYGAITVARAQRPLHEVILNFHNPNGRDDEGKLFLQCENRLDKIYGLVGLVVPAQRLVVDYAAPAEAVVTQIASIVVKALVEEGEEGTVAGGVPKTVDQSFETAKKVVMASCRALGVSWPSGLDLRRDLENREWEKKPLVDKIQRQLQGAYGWLRGP